MEPFAIYSRKSQEDDDKQVQSIPNQEAEMLSYAARCGLSVARPLLSEAKSAKAPGRTVFNAMMERVEAGEIKGILCWKLDRLARNPVDGGRIIWAVKQYGLVIRTPQQSFSRAEDNLILMYIEFGMAQKYVDDLSRNTKRGLESKARAGWFPGQAPPGYLNTKTEERGKKTILRDPDRFDAVRRLWELIFTGTMSPRQALELADSEWGFRTRSTKKRPGQSLSRSAFYKLLCNRFYCGEFEYPKGSGNWYKGQHEAMVTEAEFQAVQRILSRTNNPRPKTGFVLPFRGLFRCGACRSSITAEVKEQIRCPNCRHKFSVKNREACSRCDLAISKMPRAVRRRYVYYHCTRKLNKSCRQKCVTAFELERQIDQSLPAFGIRQKEYEWGCNYLETLRQQDLQRVNQIDASRKKSHDRCLERLANLVRLKTSPENVGNRLLSDEEYFDMRSQLLKEKAAYESDKPSVQNEANEKSRMIGEALAVLADVEKRSWERDELKKRKVLLAFGSNHVLRDKKLEIRPEFPFSELPRPDLPVGAIFTPIEPENNRTGPTDLGEPRPASLFRVPERDDIRTKLIKRGLQRIWKQRKKWVPILERGTLWQEPITPRNRPRDNGRFTSLQKVDKNALL